MGTCGKGPILESQVIFNFRYSFQVSNKVPLTIDILQVFWKQKLKIMPSSFQLKKM